jgi:hypothetical protein
MFSLSEHFSRLTDRDYLKILIAIGNKVAFANKQSPDPQLGGAYESVQ